MSTPAYPSLIDDQIAIIDRQFAILGFGLPFNEVIGLPRETRVFDLKRRLAPSMKGRRIAVRVRP
ncbi:hypothetical protein [Pseudomonas petrae]|uniref:hypothetical protein n=1 Tax=Pseudomonas petrae TaxID=2912190 RepID=UPI001F3E48D8|nr:hypothetical protein [Pseudomonas petrae]MCF7536199.1 hypothetical protein [Pseudomonas petrae]